MYAYRTRACVLIILLSFIGYQIVQGLRIPLRVKSTSEEQVAIDIFHRNRHRRSDGNFEKFPNELHIHFARQGHPYDFTLRRNDYINVNVPVYHSIDDHVEEEALPDNEGSIYQDYDNGATFYVVQEFNNTHRTSLFGSFYTEDDEEHYVEPIDEEGKLDNKNIHRIFKTEPRQNNIGDYVIDDGVPLLNHSNVMDPFKYATRFKRQTITEYKVELLMVVDYSIYTFWYNDSVSTIASVKDAYAKKSLRQFYAFVISGIDMRYKSIKGVPFSISVLYSGLYISDTEADSSWTETIKITTETPNQIDGNVALSNFYIWVTTTSGLPDHDHAMLFTKYDIFRGSSGTSLAGLAYVSTICKAKSQSIVEDFFDFQLIGFAAHELGHSLGARHDGEVNNTCNGTDAYIMAAIMYYHIDSRAQNPWKFSNCSVGYFENLINNLNRSIYFPSLSPMKVYYQNYAFSMHPDLVFEQYIGNSSNCLTTLSQNFDPAALVPYDNKLVGEVYSADTQCGYIMGQGSYLCRGFYHGNFTWICNKMWCKSLTSTLCYYHIPGEGTVCGKNKWCISGECVESFNAPNVSDTCPQGDQPGLVGSINMTCSQFISTTPWQCSGSYFYERCCSSCDNIITNNTVITYDADTQCEYIKGKGSYLCRGFYDGNFTRICNKMYCKSLTNTKCYSYKPTDGTLCGKNKWCISGECVESFNASNVSDTCPHGDQPGLVGSTNMTCSQFISTTHWQCSGSYFYERCCSSCDNTITNNTVIPYDADTQCGYIRGQGSYLCRGLYDGNFTWICNKMYCKSLTNTFCRPYKPADGTLCGNKKWCISGECVETLNAPNVSVIASSGTIFKEVQLKYVESRRILLWQEALIGAGDGITSGNTSQCGIKKIVQVRGCKVTHNRAQDICPQGDQPGPVGSKNITCYQLISITPWRCSNSYYHERCCSSCNTIVTNKTVITYDADTQCGYNMGKGSYLCRGLYDGNFTWICQKMYCKSLTNTLCSSYKAADGTLCGNNKWCISGECVASSNAPNVTDKCPHGDQPGPMGWAYTSCSQLISSSPRRCSDSYYYEKCCSSCDSIMTNNKGCAYGDKSYCSVITRYNAHRYCYFTVFALNCCKACYSLKSKTKTNVATSTTITAISTTTADTANAATTNKATTTTIAAISTITADTAKASTTDKATTTTTTDTARTTTIVVDARMTTTGPDNLDLKVALGVSLAVVCIIAIALISILWRLRVKKKQKNRMSRSEAEGHPMVTSGYWGTNSDHLLSQRLHGHLDQSSESMLTVLDSHLVKLLENPRT